MNDLIYYIKYGIKRVDLDFHEQSNYKWENILKVSSIYSSFYITLIDFLMFYIPDFKNNGKPPYYTFLRHTPKPNLIKLITICHTHFAPFHPTVESTKST